MPLTYMGAGHLASAGGDIGLYQPQHQNHFTFEIDLQDIGDGGILTLSVASANLPSYSNTAVDLHFLNEARWIAGKAEFDTMELVIRDFVDTETAKILASWRNRVYDPVTGKVGYAADYKKEADLVLVGPDGSGDRVWKLVGCWPESTNFGTLDYSSADPVTITCTVRYDLAFPEKLSAVPKGTPNPVVS